MARTASPQGKSTMSKGAQIFVNEDGEPIKFYLITGPTHLCDEGGLGTTRAKAIQKRIEKYGGTVTTDMGDANVWIVNDGVLYDYQDYCSDDIDHRAEGPGFIQKCIQRKSFQEETVKVRKTMRGRYPGKRAHFTGEEKEMLCQWIAQKIPDENAGGRFGVKIYEKLVEQGEKFPKGRWGLAKNHPMQAWKEHFKKNRQELSKRINQIVAEKGYNVESKVAYRNDRRLNKRKRYVTVDEDDEEAEESGDQGEFIAEDDEVEAPPQKRKRVVQREEEEEDGEEEEEEEEGAAEEPISQGEFIAEEDEEEAPPRKRTKTIQRKDEEDEDEEEEEEEAPQPSAQDPQLDEEDEGEFQAFPEDVPASPVRRSRRAAAAEKATAPPDTQRTLVNPSPVAVRTRSRTNIRQRISRSPLAEVESEDEWPSTAATAVAVSSGSKKAEQLKRAARRNPAEPRNGASTTTSESAREVEHTLDDDELEERRSFETETDDARARDGMFADENIEGSESDNPFEFSDEEP